MMIDPPPPYECKGDICRCPRFVKASTVRRTTDCQREVDYLQLMCALLNAPRQLRIEDRPVDSSVQSLPLLAKSLPTASFFL